MSRAFFAALMTLGLLAPVAWTQDAATRRANRTIRAQEREVLNRVTQRIEWDKQLTGSTIQLDVQPGGSVVVKGSVMSESAKARAIDLVENTTGVVSVTDELAVVKNVKVIEARSSAEPFDASQSPATAPTTSRIISRP